MASARADTSKFALLTLGIPHPFAFPNMGSASQTDIVHEGGRARLGDELYPDVVSEIILARLERKDPMARATAWLRSERSWRHHLVLLLEGN
jgi:hypothetical protein